ncbi:NlpC/P60 family protein [Oscillatoria laete-virens NRMC-F 0139]|nr:NlpC/P60 family protein [Oscillatoria laete-virens NRMC-F 0139]
MMKYVIFTLCAVLALCSESSYGQKTATSSLSVNDLRNFEANSPAVRKLLSDSLALTRRKLSYRYGSADPKRGGMDCSGFIHYVLIEQGLDKVPRMSHDLYTWVEKNGNLHVVKSTNPQSPEMHQLRPGDLLFWSGTYNVKRWPPITHVMIYLGRTKDTNNPVMVGASSGRRYQGRARHGVSVFDFRFPNPRYEGKAKFVGYGAIPGLERAYAARHGRSTNPSAPMATAQ